ncbi:hypothetical protein C0J52_08690 [Blattella germanica]|nr:hypothetical protein C0J52_08690 [Blattella germanica]
MPGKYKRKTQRQSWEEIQMQRAIEMGWLKAVGKNLRVTGTKKGLGRPAAPTDRPENINHSMSITTTQPPVQTTAGPHYVKPQEISPMPSASRSGEKKRRGVGSQVLTSSPFVSALKAKEAEKRAVEERRAARRAKKQLHFDVDSEEDENCDFEADEDDNDASCIYCNDLYSRSKAGEVWLKCMKCSLWAHNECAGLSKRAKNFICELCKN